MTKMKLTASQAKALKSVALKGHPKSAYGIGVSLSTMRALSNRGLIRSLPGTGWYFSPQTCEWKITHDGLELARALIAQETPHD